jgi:hypothetical protein
LIIANDTENKAQYSSHYKNNLLHRLVFDSGLNNTLDVQAVFCDLIHISVLDQL